MAAEATKMNLGVGGYTIPVEFREQRVGVMSLRFNLGFKGDAIARLHGKVVLPARGYPRPRPGETWRGEVVERARYCLFRAIERIGIAGDNDDGGGAPARHEATEMERASALFSLARAGGFCVVFLKTRYGVAGIPMPDRRVDFAKYAEVIERLAGEHGAEVFRDEWTQRRGGYRATISSDVFVSREGAEEMLRGMREVHGGVSVSRPLDELYDGIKEPEKKAAIPASVKEAALEIARSAVTENKGGVSAGCSVAAVENDGYLDIADSKGEPIAFADQRAAWLRLDHPMVNARLRKYRERTGIQFLRRRL